MQACAVHQGAFSDLEDLLDASHKLVEESVDSRARSQQASPAVTRDPLHQVLCLLQHLSWQVLSYVWVLSA